MIKILSDFTQPFRINGYKKLWDLIKKDDIRGKFYLLFFVIEFEFESKKMELEEKVNDYIEDKGLIFNTTFMNYFPCLCYNSAGFVF